MNPFQAILSRAQWDVPNLQGEWAMIHAILVVSAAHFEAAESDPYAAGALPNPVRDALRRWKLMGVSTHVTDHHVSAKLNTYATMFG